MCGLAFVATKKKKNTGKRVYDLYTKQKSRGKEGFGFLAIDKGKLVAHERSTTEDGIKKTIFNQMSEIILFHHRMPTSTPNTLSTAHPIFVSNDELEHDYYVMHNGVITNHKRLREEHDKLGYAYTTEYIEKTYGQSMTTGELEPLEVGDIKYNDSECLAIEIARFFEGKTQEIDTYGAAAVFVVTLEKGTDKVLDIAYGQNFGRSLARQDRKGWTLIASEGPGKEVEQMKFFHFNPLTFETVDSPMEIDEAHKRTTGYGAYGGPNYQHVADDAKKSDKKAAVPKALPSGKPEEPNTDGGQPNLYGLVNALYTYGEAIDSGAPFAEFTVHSSVVKGVRHMMYYVPSIFLGSAEDRPYFADAYYHEDVIEIDPEDTPEFKAQERLEELAMKYARLEYERDTIKDLNDMGKMPDDKYKGKDANLEMDMLALEEEMSSLGIDMQEVEETLQTAQEFVEYEYSQRWK